MRADTKQLIQRTSALENEGLALSTRRDVLDLFLGRFQLSEDERKALSSKEISDDFFVAFAKVKRIHDDCKLLLRTSQQRAGLSIMEAMAATQELGYERLFRWTQCMCGPVLPIHVV